MKKKSSKQTKKHEGESSFPTSSRGSRKDSSEIRGRTRASSAAATAGRSKALRSRDENNDHEQDAPHFGGARASGFAAAGNGVRGYGQQDQREAEEYDRASGRFAPADEDYDNMEAAILNDDMQGHAFDSLDKVESRDRGQNSQALHHSKR